MATLRCFGMRIARWVIALALPSGCGGCIGILGPQGPVAAAERQILFNSLAIMLAIVIPTIVATLAFAWWFRASNTKAAYQPDFVYSGRIELIVWSIPLLTILLLGGIAWIGSHDLDPPKPLVDQAKPIEVQVVSLDWKWLFIYPDHGIAAINQLVVPAGKSVHFAITSASVLNVFFVPQLGSMIYAMNGMTTRLNLQADNVGTYNGLSAHFSGDGFSKMKFVVQAVASERFDAWVASTRAAGGTLDAASYAELAKQSVTPPRPTYGQVEPDLFDAVVTQKIAPGPGPDSGQPNPGVTNRSNQARLGAPALSDARICTPSSPAGLRAVALRTEK